MTAAASQATADPQPTSFGMKASRGFVPWLAQRHISLAVSAYQSGKLFLIGHNDQGGIAGYERTFERAMGLATDPAGQAQTLYLATAFQVWRIENALAPGESFDGYDRLFIPQAGTTTGDLDVHDIAVDADGRLVFVSARFGCLATTSDRYHFDPLWTPPFVSRLAGEDRCHLNGLAMVEGKPRYVTACAQTDLAGAWRDHRRNGGCVIDVDANAVVLEGLSMPHSPRWHDGKLWLLDSGTGWFGHADLDAGTFNRVAFCPGYCRGLAFVDGYAVVGLSLPRHEPTFDGLELGEALTKHGVSAKCGLRIIELATGDTVEWLDFDEPVRELYDVATLPGVKRPMLIGFKSDEIRTRVWADPQGLQRCQKTPAAH
ncbi:MAG: TIGR03032 family protein [Planctomycetota bacterium]